MSTFRLGSTSYVYPAGLVENVRRLAPLVSDVELILFEVEDCPSNIPSARKVAALAVLAQAHNLTYTIHLPLDLRGDQPLDSRMWRLTERVCTLAAPLEPWAWIFHLEGTDAGTPAWHAQASIALDRLIELVPDPGQLALENLESYDHEYLEPLFKRYPIARTLDVGHLWKAGRDPMPVLREWLPHTRVIHLHGYASRDGILCDHLALDVVEPAALAALLSEIEGRHGVLTLEVFEGDFFESRDVLTSLHAHPGSS